MRAAARYTALWLQDWSWWHAPLHIHDTIHIAPFFMLHKKSSSVTDLPRSSRPYDSRPGQVAPCDDVISTRPQTTSELRSPSNQHNSAEVVSRMARIKMASIPYMEGLSESHLSPHMRGQQAPQVFSKLEMLKNNYQERILQEKEQKMLKLLEQQQVRINKRLNGHRALQPPEEKAWASNWTVAKRTAGVDRAHPLKPVYPRNEPKPHRYPSANTAGIKPLLPYVRSKSGPSRTDQWKELEKSEMNLEAEIRRKEALLREKLRRTEEELRRIQKEKEEAEWEEKKAHDAKTKLRRTRFEQGDSRASAKATKESPPYREQYNRGREKAAGDNLYIDHYNGASVMAEKDSPYYRDQYRRGREKAAEDNLYIDHYSEVRVKATKESPHYRDHYNRGSGIAEKESRPTLKLNSRGRVEAERDSPISIHQYNGGIGKAGKESPLSIGEAQQYTGTNEKASPAIQSSRLTHVEDSLRDLRLDAPRIQDSRHPSSEPLQERSITPGLRQDLVPCQFCGRQFMELRLQKHAAVCEKTYNSRRKVFDSSKARAKGTELEQYLHKKGRQPSPAPQVKANSWRQKHESFLRTIRQARVVQDVVARGGKISDLPPPPPDENPDYVTCPHCSRRFAPRAAERHIPKCETIKNKPRPPPSRR
ncbi:zinc finger C2HC domain-containing protein 1C isoform X2 [Engystomops pustulosus]|uniref:zinc finger C2HC domain-containing protein 1C isoform X2 n=1 Tax=Engystomops pustulosus TaxID=76066 RepID=UPI003AFA2AB4